MENGRIDVVAWPTDCVRPDAMDSGFRCGFIERPAS
jgi:hypothetical protein